MFECFRIIAIDDQMARKKGKCCFTEFNWLMLNEIKPSYNHTILVHASRRAKTDKSISMVPVAFMHTNKTSLDLPILMC